MVLNIAFFIFLTRRWVPQMWGPGSWCEMPGG